MATDQTCGTCEQWDPTDRLGTALGLHFGMCLPRGVLTESQERCGDWTPRKEGEDDE